MELSRMLSLSVLTSGVFIIAISGITIFMHSEYLKRPCAIRTYDELSLLEMQSAQLLKHSRLSEHLLCESRQRTSLAQSTPSENNLINTRSGMATFNTVSGLKETTEVVSAEMQSALISPPFLFKNRKSIRHLRKLRCNICLPSSIY